MSAAVTGIRYGCFGSHPMGSVLPALNDDDALVLAGDRLAIQITNALGVAFGDVWTSLTHLPDGYLRLLESPEGWTALSAIVAADLGISPVPVIPVLH